jgi:hypothetical protein
LTERALVEQKPDNLTAFIMSTPSRSSDEEVTYLIGLPSRPRLVGRSGIAPWQEPTGFKSHPDRLELLPVGIHKLVSPDVWESAVAPRLHTLLDEMDVKWTSTDVVRIGITDEPSKRAPVVVWVGVVPGSLALSKGAIVATRCRAVLEEHDIVDVDVEIRESLVTRSAAGPKLLEHEKYPPCRMIGEVDTVDDVREPLTSSLGIPICARGTPHVEGTGGFYVTVGDDADRLLLVTARHVVLPPKPDRNEHFVYEGDGPQHDVMLFGDAAFSNYLKSIQQKIRLETYSAEYQGRMVMHYAGAEHEKAEKGQRDAQKKLKEAGQEVQALNAFYEEVSAGWSDPDNRLLGHIVLSPPIRAGAGSSAEGYTEDWAVVEIDSSKIDASNFNGNAIDLGTRISLTDFIQKMSPEFPAKRSFDYPLDRLLRLKGTIPEEHMRLPPKFDTNGVPRPRATTRGRATGKDVSRLRVAKRGSATGLTVGCANNVFSYTRIYDDSGVACGISKEWAILALNEKSGVFSAKGDSGSVVVDSNGRLGGLITSGAGSAGAYDITYATPISFVLKRMQESGLREPNISPVLAA